MTAITDLLRTANYIGRNAWVSLPAQKIFPSVFFSFPHTEFLFRCVPEISMFFDECAEKNFVVVTKADNELAAKLCYFWDCHSDYRVNSKNGVHTVKAPIVSGVISPEILNLSSIANGLCARTILVPADYNLYGNSEPCEITLKGEVHITDSGKQKLKYHHSVNNTTDPRFIIKLIKLSLLFAAVKKQTIITEEAIHLGLDLLL